MYFQRGTLTPEQTRLVLRDLPIDVSFADEHDVLVYWSGATYKTCDARYIGRDVRDCHPQQSLAVLEAILREFKAGTKDVAEGWSTLPDGSVKLTRYLAVRDGGTYKGTLETIVRLAQFQRYQGEQALPGW